MDNTLSTALVIEVLATGANLLYILFLVREKIICWAFGIIGSLLSIYLFYTARLYSESILYGIYAVLGCWGWLRWHRRQQENNNPVITRHSGFHMAAVILGSLAAMGLGLSMQFYSDAERPLIDAFTTVFSLLATYLEINKVLEGWIYWLVLNLVSVWLYHDRALDIYAALIAIYSVMSVWGFVRWHRTWRSQQAAAGA